jgi:serine/threonine protein kinase
MKCTYYDENNEFSTFEDDEYGCDFFRKYSSDIEKRICYQMLQHPHKNIISIYNVKGNTVDMEMLKVCESVSPQILSDVILGLEHLHKYNIVYVDLKIDNVGYSEKDKCYKIFDFDMSGIVENEKQWRYKPVEGFLLEQITKRYEIKNLFDIDKHALKIFKTNSW